MKCKDYYIFKIKYFADKKILDEWHKNNGPTPKQHWQRAQDYNKFIWKFIKKVTGKPDTYWYKTYAFEARECAFEYVEEMIDTDSSEPSIIAKKGKGKAKGKSKNCFKKFINKIKSRIKSRKGRKRR